MLKALKRGLLHIISIIDVITASRAYLHASLKQLQTAAKAVSAAAAVSLLLSLMLHTQARRTKEMLSANTEAPFIVEELLDGKDFRSSIKRQELEDLAGDFFQRAARPLQRLLQRNGLAPADIDAVELLGGGSRIPKLQAELGHVLKGRVLDK